MRKSFKDIKGQRFGRLMANKYEGHLPDACGDKRHYWKCACDCGTEKVVMQRYLLNGDTQSCGCYAIDTRRKNATTHGMKRFPEYTVWKGIRGRCNDKNHSSYSLYGGRGISYCKDWEEFEKFYQDMGPRPSKKHQLDRIDNNGSYCKENCRWVTVSENTRNNSRSKWWYIKGHVFDACIEAAKFFNVSTVTIYTWTKKREDCWSELKYKNPN